MTRPLVAWLYGDLVCPWSYLALARLRRLEGRLPLALGWRPLRRSSAGSASPGPEGASEPGGTERPGDFASDLAALGLPYGPPAPVPDSGPALRAVEFAADLGPASRDRVLDGLFRAHFSGAVALDDRASLLGVCERLGLDPEGLAGALEDGRYDAELEAAEAEADRYGIEAVPVVLFGRLKIVGAAPLELMAAVAERAIAEG
ncbi:MAG: DsbA family protein [Gemmatimonadota bacterium]